MQEAIHRLEEKASTLILLSFPVNSNIVQLLQTRPIFAAISLAANRDLLDLKIILSRLLVKENGISQTAKDCFSL
jgi:hypothetical protein